jgi:lipopolysaccharide transport system ATP-binding protein
MCSKKQDQDSLMSSNPITSNPPTLDQTKEPAIRANGVGKIFQIYEKPHHRLMQGVYRGKKKFYEEFCALDNVSFEVSKGEVIGITGRNGSGKSTLLQIIVGTMTPSSGSVETNGRIAALLELGTGFNPEFTGRENIFLNASILGLSTIEIQLRLDSILEFAEIGQFIDQPTKTYSSGMLLRLAFAIAINVDPEILIVDEALSVGDERFQRKCFSRIEEIKNKGATILFVSHAAGTIVELCDRALLIDSGELLTLGTPKTVVGNYQRLLYAPTDKVEEIRTQIRDNTLIVPAIKHISSEKDEQQDELELYDPDLVPKSTISYEEQGATIHSPKILTLKGRQVNNLRRGGEYRYQYIVTFSESVQEVNFGMAIKGLTGVALGGAASNSTHKASIDSVQSGDEFIVEFKFRCHLNPAVYFLNAGVLGDRQGEQLYLHRLLDIAMFRVMPALDLSPTGMVDFDAVNSYTLIS